MFRFSVNIYPFQKHPCSIKMVASPSLPIFFSLSSSLASLPTPLAPWTRCLPLSTTLLVLWCESKQSWIKYIFLRNPHNNNKNCKKIYHTAHDSKGCRLESWNPYCGREVRRIEDTKTGEECALHCTKARSFPRADALIPSPLSPEAVLVSCRLKRKLTPVNSRPCLYLHHEEK